MCRAGKLFRKKFLEMKLQPSMIPCRNEECEKLLLPWSQEGHRATCKFTEEKCFLCECPVSLSSIIEHIKTECDPEWLEKDDNATSGNATMVLHQLDSGNQFTIKLPDTKAIFCIILHQMVLMLRWVDDVGYYVALVDCEQSSSRMEINYMLKPNSNCTVHSTMSLISVNSLQDIESLEKLAYLPVDIQEIAFTRYNINEYEVVNL